MTTQTSLASYNVGMHKTSSWHFKLIAMKQTESGMKLLLNSEILQNTLAEHIPDTQRQKIKGMHASI